MATLISLSPNAERDDIRLALHTLVRPWTWTNADAVVKAKQAVSGLVPNTKAVLASSGRTAIAATLAAAGIGEGDEVIVQAFTCVAVPGAVKWTGARAVFVDIDPTTFNMDVAAVAGAIGTHTKAIIVQHTFGIRDPLRS